LLWRKKKKQNHVKSRKRGFFFNVFIHYSYLSRVSVANFWSDKSQTYLYLGQYIKEGQKSRYITKEVKMSNLKRLKSYLTLKKFYNHNQNYFYGPTFVGNIKEIYFNPNVDASTFG